MSKIKAVAQRGRQCVNRNPCGARGMQSSCQGGNWSSVIILSKCCRAVAQQGRQCVNRNPCRARGMQSSCQGGNWSSELYYQNAAPRWPVPHTPADARRHRVWAPVLQWQAGCDPQAKACLRVPSPAPPLPGLSPSLSCKQGAALAQAPRALKPICRAARHLADTERSSLALIPMVMT